MRDLLVGQILWAQPSRLLWAALVYAVILVLWFGWRERLGRTGFYVLFALAVTVSVQLVGLYLVFATLIVPPLATRKMVRNGGWPRRGRSGCGLRDRAVVSTALDLPSGPVIVWVLVVFPVRNVLIARKKRERVQGATSPPEKRERSKHGPAHCLSVHRSRKEQALFFQCSCR